MRDPSDGRRGAVARRFRRRGLIEFANQRADFRLRRITGAGDRSAPVVVSTVAGNRTSGYPRMALGGDELVFAWVDREGGSQVRTAVARLPGARRNGSR